MAATKRIPVSENTWKKLSELKKTGQTFDKLLAEIVEREKKYRLMQDMKKIEEEEEFVELEL
jgi:predicted CopG family antitoxin